MRVLVAMASGALARGGSKSWRRSFVAIRARCFLMCAVQRKLRGGVIEFQDALPGIAGVARFALERSPVLVGMAGFTSEGREMVLARCGSGLALHRCRHNVDGSRQHGLVAIGTCHGSVFAAQGKSGFCVSRGRKCGGLEPVLFVTQVALVL